MNIDRHITSGLLLAKVYVHTGWRSLWRYTSLLHRQANPRKHCHQRQGGGNVFFNTGHGGRAPTKTLMHSDAALINIATAIYCFMEIQEDGSNLTPG